MKSDNFAVRVEEVSKIYRLWNSPQDQLIYASKKLFNHLLPYRKRTSNEDTAKSYRDFYALKDISLDIRKGESWGFIGVNGSGKSTLLKIISGNLRPSTGRLEIDGKVVILDYGSGFNGEFTGKENIYIKATLLGLTRKKINERYHSIVEFAELGDFINQPVKTYSSGMVSRLGFAIMAHVDADIIITDEALAVGDVFFIQKCMHFIRDFLKKGTFLFVSHSVPDVLSLCQQAVWLNQGVVQAIGPAAKVAKAYLDKANVNAANDATDSEDEDIQTFEENKKTIIVLGKPALAPNIESQIEPIAKNTSAISESNITQPIFETVNYSDLGGARILNAVLYNESEQFISQITGGELVKLQVEVMAESYLKSPFVSFQVLDRLGQILFSDHSHFAASQKPFEIEMNTTFLVNFGFYMPLLPPGNYVFRILIGAMDQENTTKVLHTLHNALVIHSVTTEPRHGLVGIPIHSIKLKCKSVATGIKNEETYK